MAEAQVRVGMPSDEFLEAVHNEPADLLHGADILPGFELKLADLFPNDEE